MSRVYTSLVPSLYKLALESRQSEDLVLSAKTPRALNKAASQKAVIDAALVENLGKLASSVLDSLAANTKEEDLEHLSGKTKRDKSKKGTSIKTSGLTPARAMAISAGLSLPAGLAGLALLREADDTVNARMLAIPGVAAATVAAVLAAKNSMDKKASLVGMQTELKELADAVKVSFLIPELAKDPEFTKVSGDLTLANRHHIASLVNSLLFS